MGESASVIQAYAVIYSPLVYCCIWERMPYFNSSALTKVNLSLVDAKADLLVSHVHASLESESSQVVDVFREE